jgi:hypothetical protein
MAPEVHYSVHKSPPLVSILTYSDIKKGIITTGVWTAEGRSDSK